MLIIYDLCGSMVIDIQSPHGLMLGWPLCSLGAGAKYRISHDWYDSEFNYRSGQLCTLDEKFNVQNIKQSTEIFCFTRDRLKLRNGLTLLLT